MKKKPAAWRSLRHSRGAATRVPELVAQCIVPGPPSHAEDPFLTLRNSFVVPGSWFDASARTVGLLLESSTRLADPTPFFTLVADILGGDQLRGWLAPPDAPAPGNEADSHDAALERKTILLAALASESGRVRGAAAMTIAMLPELADEAMPLLIERASTDADEIARAGAILALGRLDPEDTVLAAGAPPLVRGAAALAWLRREPTRRFDEVSEELLLWLDYERTVPWFDGRELFRGLFFPDAIARVLIGLARGRGGSPISLAGRARGAAEAQLAKVMLALGGFPAAGAADAIPLPSELTAEQRLVAEELAETQLLPGGGFGLPASGAVRRRWLGREAPGPLDRGTPPLWRAWRGRQPEPEDFATPADRWQALLEYMAGSYPPAFRGPRIDQLDAEIASLPASDELLTRIELVNNDLAARFAAVRRTRTIAPFADIRVSVLALEPWLRAGRAIPEAWDPLVHVGTEPQSRALLERLPADRRKRALITYLESAGPATRAAAEVVVRALS